VVEKKGTIKIRLSKSFFKDWLKRNIWTILEVAYVLFMCYLCYLWGREAVLTDLINKAGGLEDFCNGIITNNLMRLP